MWLNLLSLGVKTGAKIYQNKQRTKQLMSDAQMLHAEQMAKGEIEYKAKVIESNDNGFGKTNLSSLLRILKINLCLFFYWVICQNFSDDPEIRTKARFIFWEFLITYLIGIKLYSLGLYLQPFLLR